MISAAALAGGAANSCRATSRIISSATLNKQRPTGSGFIKKGTHQPRTALIPRCIHVQTHTFLCHIYK